MGRRRAGVVWSPEALSDLAGIWTYYLQIAGPDTAEKVAREIGEGADVLAEQPLAGKARSEIRPGLRSLVAPPHLLFYRAPGDGLPEIVRVLDSRQDIEDAFSA